MAENRGGGGESLWQKTVLVDETRELLQHIVSVFERACDSMGMKINVGKREVLVVKKDQRESCKKVRVNGEEMHVVDMFNYLGLMISTMTV